MRHDKLWITIVFVLLLMLSSPAYAQKKPQKTPAKKSTVQKTTTPKKTATQKPASQKNTDTKTTTQKSTEPAPKLSGEKSTGDAAQDEKKVRDIVAFLQYMLNTLGSSQTPARDKDVMITESYEKIFRDSKVQVEDDLDEERFVITNKDVVAYLKDVDFFFSDIRFEFTIEDIKRSTLSNGLVFYKVALTRNMKGTSTDGQAVNSTKPRFIEVNYDPDQQDLKIVSMYTNEFNEKEALTNWWKELSYEWQAIFRKKLNLTDSISLSDIKNMTAIDALDLSNNKYIQSIEPLAQILGLRSLNLSNTAISDLTPIRNLTELVNLNISGTKVFDLTPLKYATKLEQLNLSNTDIRDIEVVEKMPALRSLQMRGTHVLDFSHLASLTALQTLNLERTQLSDLSPLSNLTTLTDLNIGQTAIENLTAIKTLKNLTVLDIDSTVVQDITPLSHLEKLKILHANHTAISNLASIQKLAQLEKIYVDQTGVKKETAHAFIASHPTVLVIFDTKDMMSWWTGLSPQWQSVFSKAAATSANPTKEELAKITSLDSINISENRSIYHLEPVQKLQKLRVLIANKTAIKDITGIQDAKQLRYLDISDTDIANLASLASLPELTVLRADRCTFENLEPVYAVATLREVYVDQTMVHDIIAREFFEKNNNCLLVYKTVHLHRWWANLSDTWKGVLKTQAMKDTIATRENLHRLAELERLEFKDAPIRDLSALNEFVRLKELILSGTGISSIPSLENLRSLRLLHATNSPLQNIDALGAMKDLNDLDISNTPVDDLKPLSILDNLEKLNCAGTQIKKLDPLERLGKLTLFDCSNTRVTSLDALRGLPLKTLKCYNTKVSSREIENFKKMKPECNVVYYR